MANRVCYHRGQWTDAWRSTAGTGTTACRCTPPPTFLHEFPFSNYRALPGMVRGSDGWWRLRERNDSIPQLFSLRAAKPAGDREADDE